MKQKFDVTGMSCSACSAHIEKSVSKLVGVQGVNVNLLANTMGVEYDEMLLDEDNIVKTVESAGYGAVPRKDSTSETGGESVSLKQGQQDVMETELKGMKKRLILSFLFLVPVFYISMGHMAGWPLPAIFHGSENALIFAFTQFLLLLPIAYVNRKYYSSGFQSLWNKAPNMDSLIAIGSLAAIVYGIFAIFKIGYGLGHGFPGMVSRYSMDLYFESAAMILTLITLGKYFETKSKGKTSEAISKLMDLAPKTAIVIRQGEEMVVAVDEVRVGDVVIVKPGQRIPVDGIVVEGETSVDESPLTGESMPVFKTSGDKILSATMNQTGYLKLEAVKVGRDTTLAKIIDLVEEAGASKAPIAKLADKVSGVFVPVVIAISVITLIVWLLLGRSMEFALSVSIAVLVISCPCALGLATPVAIMVGTGKGAENGILIKSAEALETAHLVDTVVLDKTGTITEGKPVVTNILLGESGEVQDVVTLENQFLTLAASIEKPSEHPLAAAILEEAKKRNLPLIETEHFTALSGRGVEVKIGKDRYIAGNLRLMEENKIEMESMLDKANRLAEEGKTPLYFAEDKNLLGMIAVADVAKPTSQEAIRRMEEMSLEVIMLTGDNQKTAEAIGKQLGMSRVVSEVLPQDKEAEIRKLKEEGKRVAMIGDGINDAPALMRADVGIAISAAADIAIESADIVLMKDDLLDGVTAIQLSKAVIRNIKQNLFWAFFYNALGIPLAAGVFYMALGWTLNPMFAAFAMSLSSVCVVSNALRLKLFKGLRAEGNKGQFHSGKEPADEGSQKNKKGNEREEKMEKIMQINGMMCAHCTGRVEKALNGIEGVTAEADLDGKLCRIQLSQPVSDDTLIHAVTAEGYEVVSIK